MSRISDLLKSIRITLADPQSDRWSEESLLIKLDEGQKDFCIRTDFLEKRLPIVSPINSIDIPLPPDCRLLRRVLYKNKNLPFVTYNELDENSVYTESTFDYYSSYSGRWEDKKGYPLYVVYDKRKYSEIRLFPTPNEADSVVRYIPNTFVDVDDVVFDSIDGKVSDIIVEDQHFNINSFDGKLSDVNYDNYFVDFDSFDGIVNTLILSEKRSTNLQYGRITKLDDLKLVNIARKRGRITSITDSNLDFTITPNERGLMKNVRLEYITLICYYIGVPSTVTTINDDLEIPPTYDAALKYYVCGSAFLDDFDAANQQKANSQIILYEKYVKEARKDKSYSNTTKSRVGFNYRRVI